MRGQAAKSMSLDASIDHLNARLKEAEQTLTNLPGKPGWTEVPLPDQTAAAFGRTGDAWWLVLDTDPGGSAPLKRWTECSVEEKAMLAAALPRLYAQMQNSIQQRRTIVDAAHAALDLFETQVRAVKGGA
jgi:hypothetical protein